MKSVVVISAHPDDEILGCGGTLLKHKMAGDDIYWVIVTQMDETAVGAKRIAERNKEIETIAERLQVREVFQLKYLSATLTDTDVPNLVSDIATIFKKIEPEILYVLNRSDAHSDHGITYKSVIACTKSFRYPSILKVYMYECLSETEFAAPLHENVFLPNHYVNISNYMEEKLALMQVYESEIGAPPFPRSVENIKALGTLRGGVAGFRYAEAFQVLKSIEP